MELVSVFQIQAINDFFSTQHYVPLSKVKHVELVHSDPAAYITYVNISK